MCNSLRGVISTTLCDVHERRRDPIDLPQRGTGLGQIKRKVDTVLLLPRSGAPCWDLLLVSNGNSVWLLDACAGVRRVLVILRRVNRQSKRCTARGEC
jgi:hypothetical protein